MECDSFPSRSRTASRRKGERCRCEPVPRGQLGDEKLTWLLGEGVWSWRLSNVIHGNHLSSRITGTDMCERMPLENRHVTGVNSKVGDHSAR